MAVEDAVLDVLVDPLAGRRLVRGVSWSGVTWSWVSWSCVGWVWVSGRGRSVDDVVGHGG